MSDSRRHVRDWLTLHLVPGIGPGMCARLVDHFGSPREVLAADPPALLRVPGFGKKMLAALAGQFASGQAADEAAKEEERARQLGIDLITLDDPAYPALLRTIHQPPVILYVKGVAAALDSPGLGVVGSRAATSYGREVAGRLSYSLAQHGFTIISGLALGIDTEAHRGALAAGGRTVAVLGCGLDIVYPASNRDLFDAIPEAGALVSEYPLGTQPDGFRFPARNRIISGLGLGVVVVEAAKKSGSLITAEHALEQGREVFAIPGRVDSFKSAGTHGLLKQGAKLVQTVDDILEELPFVKTEKSSDNSLLSEERGDGPALAPDEEVVYRVLEVYPKTIDEIVRATAFQPQKVNGLLLHMELKGVVDVLPGGSYKRATA